MRKLFYCDTVGNLGSIPLLILRVVMGVAFMYHGYDKVKTPMEWANPFMGESAPPPMLQAAAAYSEFGGGALLIAGLLTRLAALGLGATMVGAVQYHVQRGDPFVGQGAWELAAVYLACAILFLILGPGRISLDALLFGSREPATPGHT
jgi:putative oxidoreductase